MKTRLGIKRWWQLEYKQQDARCNFTLNLSSKYKISPKLLENVTIYKLLDQPIIRNSIYLLYQYYWLVYIKPAAYSCKLLRFNKHHIDC